jgi:multicomponent Na+:H+ antiporter subunit G
MDVFKIIGLIFIISGLIFISIGLYGITRYNNFYTKISIASLIDTAGFILVCTGVIFYQGLTFFSLKVCLIIGLTLLLNPLTNHIIVQSAYISGYSIKGDKK